MRRVWEVKVSGFHLFVIAVSFEEACDKAIEHIKVNSPDTVVDFVAVVQIPGPILVE